MCAYFKYYLHTMFGNNQKKYFQKKYIYNPRYYLYLVLKTRECCKKGLQIQKLSENLQHV